MEKSNKHGGIRLCPNCGANVGSFAGKCPECGHEFNDIDGNSSVAKLQQQLDELDAQRQSNGSLSGLGSRFSGALGADPITNRKIQLIKNFSVPNSKEDLIEFATLCMTQLADAGADTYTKEAWRAKTEQVAAKASALFPNDPDVKSILGQMKKKKGMPRAVLAAIIAVVLFGGLGLIAFLGVSGEKNEAKDIESYGIEMCGKIEALPTPDTDNYKDCFRKFNAIKWTNDTIRKWENGYRAFKEAQQSYKELLLSSYLEAGVPVAQIPQSLKEGSEIPDVASEEQEQEQEPFVGIKILE